MIRWCRYATEAILLMMACLAPWALGSVQAQFELCLSVGVVLLALLGVVVGWGADRSRALWCLPSVALAGLVGLALIQSAPLPESVLRIVAPRKAALRAQLLPAAPEQVVGDSGATVSLPAATLSQDPETTLQMAARLASAWIVFQSVLTLGGGFATFRRFATAIAANATLLALFALVQRLTWNGKIYWTFPAPFGDAGPFVCHNHLAAYLNLGLGFALAFLLSPRRAGDGSRLWAAYAAGVIVVGIVMSLSRSAFLAMAVALVVSVVVLRPRGLVLAAFLGSALVLIPAFLIALGNSAPYQQRIATLLARGPYSDRLQIWRDAVRAWPVDPFFGTGLGSFATATARFFQRDTGEGFLHAENEYVEWLVEGGIVGFGLALAAVFGIARLARRALLARPEEGDRALILGAIFGGVTLLVHSAADFALHIPGVAVTVVLLCAHLSKSGLDAGRELAVPRLKDNSSEAPLRRPRGAIPALAMAGASLFLLFAVANRALAEATVVATPLAPSGAVPLTSDQDDYNWPDDLDWPEATALGDALAKSLRYRPDWAEGHLRYGIHLVELYKRWTREGLRQFKVPAADAMADPSWLYNEVHYPVGNEPLTAEALVKEDAVRAYLVPAARSFLEARRCNPLLPLPHAKLATLDFLLRGADPARVYLDRAVRLASADRRVLERITETAVALRELEAAARGWKQLLILDPTRWEEVADAASRVLGPDQILEQVVPDGRLAIRFAQRLYGAPWRLAARQRFLNEAIRRLPDDPGLTPAERLRYEGEAWAQLGDQARAQEQMKRALGLEPRQTEWRTELVGWLLEGGRPQEAYDEALVALHFAPQDPEARHALERAAEALARSPEGTLSQTKQ